MTRSFATASEFIGSNYDPIVEKAFFGRVVLANGSFKSTDSHRLDDLNIAILPHIKAMQERPLDIKDVACSSGISTQEWHDSLRDAGIEVRLLGTDVSVEAFHLRGYQLDALLDGDGNVIHLSIFRRAVHPRALKVIRRFGLNQVIRFRIGMGAKPVPIRLISKAVRDVKIVYNDLERSDSRPDSFFHVIRAANILNLSYFSENRLRNIILNLLKGLRDGGLFVVCRTYEDGSNHGTIFRYQGSQLSVIGRIGKGSEVEQILRLSR